MPDHTITLTPAEAETAARIRLAAKLRRAADELERQGVNFVRHWDARGICVAALNDIDRAIDYGRPGLGIDDLLGDNHVGS